jgi:iron complex outermembrane receptor protein
MKKCLSFLNVLTMTTLGFTAAAQQPVTGKVSGQLSSGQKPVESATVAVLRSKDSGVVKLGVSDKAGQFEIDNIKTGRYLVSVQALGHAKYYSKPFELSASQLSVVIPAIELQAAAGQLNNVTVVSQKPLIEQKIDRTVLNVEASVTNAGTTAMDVLEKSPGVSVDKDGNISLKGKQGVQIFIDGRPTYLSGQDLANMLRNMQSNQLDQVEIMTNPPAKYDASGNSGIINIKTKKNKQVGYNGSVTVGYGQGVYPKTNESLNMNYRDGKVNLFGNANYAYRERFQELKIQRKFIDALSKNVTSNFEQQNNLRNNDESYGGKIGLDYFASKKTTLGVVLNASQSTNPFSSRGTINIFDPNYVLQSQTRAASDNDQVWKNYSTNVNFRQLLDTTGADLTGDFDYIHYSSANNQQVTNGYYNASGGVLAGSRPDTLLGNLPQRINIYSLKLDFTKPLKGGARFEAGLKSSFVKTDNNAAYDSIRNGAIVRDLNRSNHFVYEENINAGYLNYSRPFSKKISAQLGLRVEHTHSIGNQLTTNTVFKRDYVQLFPTAYFQYQPNQKNTFVMNYGKRINRPNYQDLNPFVTFLDRYTYQQGNPNLQPQFSHNIELSHSYNNFLTTTLNYTRTTDIIQDVLEQNTLKNESYIKKSNIARQRQYGVSVNAFLPLTKWWTSNIYLNVFNNEFSGIINGDPVTISATTGMFNIMEQFKFNKGWGAELSGFGRTEGVEGIFRIKAFGTMNLGVSKQMLKNKGTLRLSVRDVLWSQRIKGESRYSNIDATFQQFGESRVVNLSFTYRFSKGKVQNVQRKRGGANEEASRVKGGDSQ